MRRAAWVAVTSLVLLLASGPATAGAAPVGGLGEHVSSIAPEHPREDGAMFGQCVSTMATTGECPGH